MSSILRKFKHREDRDSADKTTFMMRNGENLLKNLISASNGKYNLLRMFSVEDLETATNNFDEQNVIKRDVFYKLYKGFLQDCLISVIKFDHNKYDANKDCFNIIVFASQMRHKNILKLIGCCLETEVPILVFEAVEYGTLADRICGPHQPHFEPLLLTHRLKIAMEIAHATAYLHAGFPRPIVFRSFGLSNIVFHEQYVAKLFDFSLAMSIPKDKTHAEDFVIQGTLGYIAPEITARFNEKWDVYGFGALSLELLSRCTHEFYYIKTSDDEECYYSLASRVKKYITKNTFVEILDPIMVGDGLCPEEEKRVKAFLELVVKCLSLSPQERPTMIDVAKQLRQIYRSS